MSDLGKKISPALQPSSGVQQRYFWTKRNQLYKLGSFNDITDQQANGGQS